MKILILMILAINVAFAQNLSPNEQKELIDENKMLREELKKLQNNPEGSKNLMDALKRGQKYQEEQNKALEELDKEL
jgi:hypothetical protein